MAAVTITKNKTKILLTLTLEQKELMTKLAESKGLSLSAYLRFKGLEDAQPTTSGNSTADKIQQYLSKKRAIPKKYSDYKDFKDFHKKNYRV